MAVTGAVVLVAALFHDVHPIREGLSVKSISGRPITIPTLFRENPPEPNHVLFFAKRRAAVVESSMAIVQ